MSDHNMLHLHISRELSREIISGQILNISFALISLLRKNWHNVLKSILVYKIDKFICLRLVLRQTFNFVV